MTTQEERAAPRAFWMQHLRECSKARERLSIYARRHELKVGEGYHWTRLLKREGLWPLPPTGEASGQSVILKRKPIPRFARVRTAVCAHFEAVTSVWKNGCYHTPIPSNQGPPPCQRIQPRA